MRVMSDRKSYNLPRWEQLEGSKLEYAMDFNRWADRCNETIDSITARIIGDGSSLQLVTLSATDGIWRGTLQSDNEGRHTIEVTANTPNQVRNRRFIVTVVDPRACW